MAEQEPGAAWRDLLRRSLAFIRPHRATIAVVLVLALAVAAASTGEPLALKYVFDQIGRGDARAVAVGALAFLLLGVAIEGLSGLSNWMTWRLRLRVQEHLLDATAAKIYRLPLSFHQCEHVGGLVTRVERGINGTLGALTELAFNVLPATAYLAASLVVMARLDWRLFAVVLAFTGAPAAIGAWAVGEQTRREERLLRSWTRIYSRHYEALTGILTVKCFAQEDEERSRFLRDVGEANGIVVSGVRFDTRVGAAKNLVTLAARVILTLVGAHLVLHGAATVGTVVAFLGYAGGIFGPVQSLTGVYETLRRASVSLDTVLSLLATPEGVSDREGARPAPRLRGEVAFEGLHFAYAPERPVLMGLDLRVAPGERVAIVGPSGTGKTTLMWLLLRFHDPGSGTVRVDGIDVRTLQQRAFREQIGVVLQDTVLFDGSIGENVAYGRPGARASAAEIEAAARAANAHEFIQRLPHGYDTRVGERGTTLSSGERQRIAIARAVLRDPRILVLDEATSNLDPASEAVVRDALHRLARGRTTFVIAHRVSMAMDADRIVVLEGGRIAEVGTHRELAATGGYYAAMLRHQLRGLAADASEPRARA